MNKAVNKNKELEYAIGVYRSIVNGEAKKFPKGFFFGPIGRLHAKLIFKLFMNEFAIPHFHMTCLQDAYEVFASKEINVLLEKCNLSAFVEDRFGIALNFLQTCLGKDADDVAYYHAFFSRPRANRSVFLLTGYRVQQLNNGTLPREYEAYVAYQEALEKQGFQNKTENTPCNYINKMI